MQQNCTTSEIKYTLQNKHNTEAFQTFGCIMSILSLSLTAITETEVVDCFMQVRFEVLPVVTMKTPSSAMWCHVVSQKCADISETPTAVFIMRVYNEGSKFLWDTGTLLLDYMALHAIQPTVCYTLFIKKSRHFMCKSNNERYKDSDYHWDWITY